jgi:hypothetical protein
MTDWHIPELKQSLRELREYEDNMTIFERFDEKFPTIREYDTDFELIISNCNDEIKSFFRDELTALAKECIGEEQLDGYGDKLSMAAETGYNTKRQEVIAVFKKLGIEI